MYATLSPKLQSFHGYIIQFWCPGCEVKHSVTVEHPDNPSQCAWGFNKDYDKPTFTPSIKTTLPPTVEDGTSKICHLFLTDGKLQFLSDCWHPLANQTVDLPDFPANGNEVV